MKYMKKFGLAVMLFAIIMSLVACGSDSSKEKESSSKGNTLTVSVEETYKPFIDEIKGQFEKDNDVKVKVVEKPMFDQLEALPLDGPGGNAPDVLMSAYDRVGSLGQQGHLLETKDNENNKLDEKAKQTVTIDGKRFGTPFTVETLVQFYNKDLVDKAPATMQEAEALAKDPRFSFANEPGKSTAFLADWNDFYILYGELAGYGAYTFGKDGTDPKDVGLNNKGAVEGLEYATKWYNDIWPQGMKDAKSAKDLINQMFIEGKAASIISGPWAATNYKEAKVNYGVAKLPTLPNGKEYTPFSGGKAWVASAYSQQPELAQKWIDYVTNEENSYKFYEHVNEIPMNKAAQEKVIATNDELAKAVIETYEVAQPMPNIPEMGEIWTAGATLMADAISGKKTPKQAAEAAVKTINENIEQKYNN
ncbi:extracellular solute-binding protein [Bacillus sp. JJ722]|uniref:extracellular solute-binding protein n=1 Tax=Bacillus sp. JJ722 TaxID=3122973 RepID=UPI002FFE5E90